MQRPNRFILAAGIGLVLFNTCPAPGAADRPNRFSEKRKIRIKGPGFRTVGGPYVNVVDWNGDTIDDLVMGQYAGAVAVYLRKKDGSFEDVKWIHVNGQTKVFGYARIAVTDWNDDGKLDFLVSDGGKPFVELYLNTGTTTEPQFKDGNIPGFGAFKQGSNLLLGTGKPLRFERPYGISVADWNRDGTRDVIIGNNRGEVWLFLNKGQKGRPSLAQPAPISARGNTVLGDRDRATPSAADWNGDGKMDLLVTDYPGRLHLYLNKGTPAKASLVPYDGKAGILPVTTGGNSFLCDWDGDGKKDLVLGGRSGYVHIVRDAVKMTTSSPKKGASGLKWQKERIHGIDFIYRSFLTLAFTDLTGDGEDDIIAGSYNRGLHIYPNSGAKGKPEYQRPLIPVHGSMWSKYMGIPGPGYNIRYTQPFPFDWNQDGAPDIVLGGNGGTVVLLLNLGTREEPHFHSYQSVGVNKRVLCKLKEGWAVPIVVDRDKDTIPDLLIGGASGKVYCAINRGHPRFPCFPELIPLKADGKELNVGSHASPFLTDWDGDGHSDLLVGGGKGMIHLFLYDAGKKEFAHAGCLASDLGPIKTRARARPWMTDWNNDGLADLVVIGPDDHAYCYLSAAN